MHEQPYSPELGPIEDPEVLIGRVEFALHGTLPGYNLGDSVTLRCKLDGVTHIHRLGYQTLDSEGGLGVFTYIVDAPEPEMFILAEGKVQHWRVVGDQLVQNEDDADAELVLNAKLKRAVAMAQNPAFFHAEKGVRSAAS